MLSPLYGQLSPLRVPTRVASGPDADALAYIAAVEAADGQALEEGVATAFTDFIVGCKADGIWSALKASCILAGARTLSGALVPLVGTAPTNNNFVSADYDRETGLKGNGTTKYLNSNRSENADPQDNVHLSVNVTQHVGGINRCIIGAYSSALSPIRLTEIIDNYGARSRSNIVYTIVSPGIATFAAMSRNNSANFESRFFGSNATTTTASLTPSSSNYYIFGRNSTGTLAIPIPHRLSFYSIGEATDLALLDTRVSTLMTDLAAAI